LYRLDWKTNLKEAEVKNKRIEELEKELEERDINDNVS